MKTSLSFRTLREANTARLPEFKNSKGEPAHEKSDGSDWTLGEWMNAVAGELGEAANIIKKVRRGDMTIEQARPLLANEFADIITYLDITAMQAGIDLGEATVDKFNQVSERVNSSVRIDALGVYSVAHCDGTCETGFCDYDKCVERKPFCDSQNPTSNNPTNKG